MRPGFSLKEAASVLQIHPQRVTQSLDPTLTKFAKLYLADPVKAMDSLLWKCRELQAERQQNNP